MQQVQMMPEKFYERFNGLLIEKNISAKKLAEVIGVSQKTVYEWIWNTRQMYTPSFMKICKFLDVDPLWLYGMSNKRKRYGE